MSASSVTEEMQQEMRALASQVAGQGRVFRSCWEAQENTANIRCLGGGKGDEPLKSLARLNPPELHHQVHQEVKRYQSTGEGHVLAAGFALGFAFESSISI